ncbi:peptidoglycan endopeptidase [Deinococcus irradiatisoli]|uniref:Peptidoglycan endopeptidase n=1 Tax=Deinococcus irradiatisoli TaxID=2202254 RepID=A0A2Z3JHL2_9DEIO|nr:peptidoglycan endopeptidase [Deinococcus irradiatisoli]
MTVQPKDTAYGIAKKYGLSVDALLALNHLSSPNLNVGQVLQVSAGTPPVPSAPRAAPQPPAAGVFYTVVKGDTAFAIARRSNLSVDALLSLNHLSSPNLSVGQVLSLPRSPADPAPALVSTPAPELAAAVVAAKTSFTVTPAVVMLAAPAPETDSDLAEEDGPSVTSPETAVQVTSSVSTLTAAPDEDSLDWWSNAQSLLGVPYAYGGKSRSGTDCSGLVFQVFSPLGLSLPRTSAEQARVGMPVDRSALQSGDLVFFDTEGHGKVTHVGIVVDGTTFINANSFAGKVAIDDLNASYWASRYVGARRVLGIMATSH